MYEGDPNAEYAYADPNAADPNAAYADPNYDPNAGYDAGGYVDPNAGYDQGYDYGAGYAADAGEWYDQAQYGMETQYDAYGQPIKFDAAGNAYDCYGQVIYQDYYGSPINSPFAADPYGAVPNAGGVGYEPAGPPAELHVEATIPRDKKKKKKKKREYLVATNEGFVTVKGNSKKPQKPVTFLPTYPCCQPCPGPCQQPAACQPPPVCQSCCCAAPCGMTSAPVPAPTVTTTTTVTPVPAEKQQPQQQIQTLTQQQAQPVLAQSLPQVATTSVVTKLPAPPTVQTTVTKLPEDELPACCMNGGVNSVPRLVIGSPSAPRFCRAPTVARAWTSVDVKGNKEITHHVTQLQQGATSKSYCRPVSCFRRKSAKRPPEVFMVASHVRDLSECYLVQQHQQPPPSVCYIQQPEQHVVKQQPQQIVVLPQEQSPSQVDPTTLIIGQPQQHYSHGACLARCC